MKALELKNVEKSFKKRRGEVVRALDSVSLAVGRGEVVGILGPNGSGKSTLVRVVSTLVVPDRGSVEVFDVDAVRHPKKVQRSMNRVSVEASFFKKMSAMENLLYGAKLYGVTSGEAHDSSILLCTHDMDEAEELCDRVGIMVDGKILALERPEDLKRRYASNGHVPTLEETFMAATGYSVEEASAEGED